MQLLQLSEDLVLLLLTGIPHQVPALGPQRGQLALVGLQATLDVPAGAHLLGQVVGQQCHALLCLGLLLILLHPGDRLAHCHQELGPLRECLAEVLPALGDRHSQGLHLRLGVTDQLLEPLSLIQAQVGQDAVGVGHGLGQQQLLGLQLAAHAQVVEQEALCQLRRGAHLHGLRQGRLLLLGPVARLPEPRLHQGHVLQGDH